MKTQKISHRFTRTDMMPLPGYRYYSYYIYKHRRKQEPMKRNETIWMRASTQHEVVYLMFHYIHNKMGMKNRNRVTLSYIRTTLPTYYAIQILSVCANVSFEIHKFIFKFRNFFLFTPIFVSLFDIQGIFILSNLFGHSLQRRYSAENLCV